MPQALPQERLRINGVVVDRDVVNVQITRRLLHNLDGPDELEFTEYGVFAPTFRLDSRVELLVAEDLDADGTIAEADYKLRFAGAIKQAPMTVGRGRPQVDYVAAGLKYLADDVRVIHPQTGEAEVRFNLPPDDPKYEEDLAILQLGEILRRVLTYDRHATALWYQGITAYTADPPYIDPDNPPAGRAYDTAGGSPAILRTATLDDLAAIDFIPESVVLAGAKLWGEIVNVLGDHAPWAGTEILPDGTIRFHDTRDPEWVEVELGVDPVHPPSLSLDASECYTAVEVIGAVRVEGETFETAEGTLIADWTAAHEAAWTYEDFNVKTNAVSKGTIQSIGPTSVTIRPTSGPTTWAANKWANERVSITLVLPVGPSNPSELTISRRIVSNTALAAGGTSVISLDYPLSQTGFTHYRMTGQGDNPRRFVHRRYKLADTDKASRIADLFPYPVIWEFRGSAQEVNTPVGKNFRQLPGTTGDMMQADLFFELFTDTDGVRKVLASDPTVASWSSKEEMEEGGSNVNKPTSILVFLPIAQELLTARYPAAGFAGVGLDTHGIKRTRYVPAPDWKYEGDSARQREYAEMIHSVVSEPAISGDLTYLGLWHPGLSAANLAVKLTSDLGATPWESTKLSIRGVEILGPASGPHAMVTRLRLSNQRRPWTGDRYHRPAEFVSGGPLSDAPDLDARV